MTHLNEAVSHALDTMPGLTLEAIASHAGVGASTLSNHLAGRHRPAPETAARVARALSEIQQHAGIQASGNGNGAAVAPPVPGALTLDELMGGDGGGRVRKRGPHYEIETTRRVEFLLSWCHRHAALGAAFGCFGAGKSHAIRHWIESHPRVPCVALVFNRFSGGNKGALVEKLAAALRVPNAPRGGTVAGGRVFDAVVEYLRERPHLLVFDQCEPISVAVADTLRQVWDETSEFGTGMALLAADSFFERLRASRARDLGALTSRIGPWGWLPGVLPAEIEQIVRKEGLDMSAEMIERLTKVVGGSMRLLMRAIEFLQERHKGRPVIAKTIDQLAATLNGLRLPKEE